MDEPEVEIIARRSISMIRNIVRGIPDGCACYKVILDDRDRIVDCIIVDMNEEFEQISGLSRCKAIGTRMSVTLKRLNPAAAEKHVPVGRETVFKDTGASIRHISLLNNDYRATLFCADERLILGIYENVQAQFFRDLYSERFPATGALEQKTVPAFRDPLTGLYDRLFAAEALKKMADGGTRPLSVVLGDVNGLKAINRDSGYRAGDEALVRIARIFREHCPREGFGARWSNDEFILLLPGVASKGARAIMDRMQKALDDLHRNGGCAGSVTLGYATGTEPSLQAEELIREAEKWTFRKKLLISESHHNSIIKLLLSTLHEKSADTQKHSDRMADYCRRVARKLHLPGETINDLVLLSMLHDIGKIGIRHEILNKPGALTPEERLEIERHPEIGFRITRSIPELTQLSDAILAHHEWWDGGGYPNGLKGEEIPILSRIIAVVDAYDVMVSGRSYRAARDSEEAIAELKRCAGTQFDPGIVKIFIDLI